MCKAIAFQVDTNFKKTATEYLSKNYKFRSPITKKVATKRIELGFIKHLKDQ